MERITGAMFYYYFVCKRKLWYFCNEIQMESFDENVILGRILDENSYKRDEKSVQIDGTINIDFVEKNGVIHEVKKSRKIEQAGIWQLKYYIWYLKQKGVENIKGEMDYPALKQKLDICLTEDDERYIKEVLREIEKIKKEELPPQCEKKGFCKKCAYFDLCFI